MIISVTIATADIALNFIETISHPRLHGSATIRRIVNLRDSLLYNKALWNLAGIVVHSGAALASKMGFLGSITCEGVSFSRRPIRLSLLGTPSAGELIAV